jgi:hypothetical protein
MFINYAHLTGIDIDKEICKLYGIETTSTQVSGEILNHESAPTVAKRTARSHRSSIYVIRPYAKMLRNQLMDLPIT